MSQTSNNEISLTAPCAGRIVVAGDLHAGNAEAFARRLLALTADGRDELTIDLGGLDIEDGTGIAVAVNALRQLCAQTAKLILVGAPQMLAHNLYRIGLLDRGQIELIDMRQDEPAGL